MSKIPSIALIPSGYKASKLYSVLPTDGAGDFTISRASIATRVNENGLIEEVASNVPRLDYSDGGCPSLLLEPIATNLVTYSEDFSNAYWAKSKQGVGLVPIVTSNDAISPNGTLNAYRVDFDRVGETSNDRSILSATPIATVGNTYTGAVWIKAATASDIGKTIGFRHVANSSYLEITLTNDWVRIERTETASGNFWDLATLGSIVGSVSVSVHIYGASLEENSYATSYIKTVGTAQTRVADTATGSGSSTVINSSEGVLYFEGSALANDLTYREISISDGTLSNAVKIEYNDLSNYIGFRVMSNSVIVEQFQISNQNITQTNKLAISYKLNDFRVFINGVKVGSSVIGVVPIDLSELAFDRGDGANPFYGKTKSVQVYTTALSDAELTNLTTI